MSNDLVCFGFPLADFSGDAVGSHQVVKLLGRGAFGEVLLVKDQGRSFAMKVSALKTRLMRAPHRATGPGPLGRAHKEIIGRFAVAF